MCLEELLEVFTRNSDVNIIVDLNGNADSVALSDAKAAVEDNLVLDVMLGDRLLEHSYNLLRALQKARGANTYLYD